MDFSGEVAEWQRNVSEGKAGNSRRYAVMEGLEVRSGKSYLDVGCGGGHLVRELGNAIGNEGRVLGIDSSPQMLEKPAPGRSNLSFGALPTDSPQGGAIMVSDFFAVVLLRMGYFDQARDLYRALGRLAQAAQVAAQQVIESNLRF